MNKPAPKEPSMDEILSSIRQIIADDDAAAPSKPMSPLGNLPPVTPAPPIRPAMAPRPIMPPPPEPEPEPLALSTEQIMLDAEDDEPVTAMNFEDILAGNDESEPEAFAGAAELVDPEDVAFETEEEDSNPMSMFSVEVEDPVMPPPVAARPAPAPMPRPIPPRPAPSFAQSAPMPDPKLSSDVAERLLEPATQSAVKSTFSRLNGLSMVGTGVTLEEMMREMLRPMLKDWLDENLPSLVERVVEKEISRISRGEE
jgi:cell pole-organizing protein PopZ